MRQRLVLTVFAVVLLGAAPALAQTATPPPGAPGGPTPLVVAATGPFEISIEGRVGFPSGYLRVGEKPLRGTTLLMDRDLGIDLSEALEAAVALHVTDRDAVRAKYLYYFLDGSTHYPWTKSFDGAGFGPGRVETDLDFYRLSLDYERQLMNAYNLIVTGTAGVTYVHFDPTIRQSGLHRREDFSADALPVPVLGLRVDVPIGAAAARLEASVGGLPEVRDFRQINADLGASILYALTRAVRLEFGYHFTYFLQHIDSHTEDNAFQMSESSLRAAVNVRF